MGEKQNQALQLSFNPCLNVDFQGSRVTSDSGLLLVRELDERLGLSARIAKNIMKDRRGKNTQLPFARSQNQESDGLDRPAQVNLSLTRAGGRHIVCRQK